MPDTLLDVSALTLNAEEADSVSQAIFEVLITGPALTEYHEVETGIEHKTQIPFIGNLGLLGKKMTSCDRSNNPGQIPLTEKFWDPVLIGDRLKHCAIDVSALLKLFRKAQRINPDFYDRIDGEEFGVIIAKVEQAMVLMLNRLVWFGDTAADNVTNSGNIKDGVDVAYFTPFDGLFKQLFTDVPTTANNYVAITENAGADYAAQANLAATRAIDTFRAMYNKMDARMHTAIQGGASPEFLVTRGLYHNYMDWLEDKSVAFTLLEVKEGSGELSYRGIPIKVRDDWDSLITSYLDNGTKYDKPNRALLTLKENIPVGTLNTEDLTALKSWFEMKDDANYIDFDLSLDAKHLLSYLTVFAY